MRFIAAIAAVAVAAAQGFKIKTPRVLPATQLQTDSPYTAYEVTPPPQVPANADMCKHVLLDHTFDSWGNPPRINYDPPADCGDPSTWALVLLTIDESSYGIQYDRLGQIAINGVQLWRTSTAEPRHSNVTWSTFKDVTNFIPVLRNPGSLLVSQDNIITDEDTGPFRLKLSLVIYQATDSFAAPAIPSDILPLGPQSDTTSMFTYPSDMATTELTIPNNTVKLFAEITASGNAEEEFWYLNVIDDLYNKDPNNTIGKGPFREVQLFIDGQIAGFVAPFPVIYTGGVSPLWWEPLVGIGAFVAKSYLIDITAFIPTLTDGVPHAYQIKVVGQGEDGSVNSNWLLSGNLQTYRNPNSEGRTTGSPPTVHIPWDPTFQASHYDFNADTNRASELVVGHHHGQVQGTIIPDNGSPLTVETIFHTYFTNDQSFDDTELSLSMSYYGSVSSTGNASTFNSQFSYPITLNENPCCGSAQDIDLYVNHTYFANISYPTFHAFASHGPVEVTNIRQGARSIAVSSNQTAPPQQNRVILDYEAGGNSYKQEVLTDGFAIKSSSISGTIPPYDTMNPPSVNTRRRSLVLDY